ncbi:MAG: cis-3-alkyl-4-acyloxetan-2-one decarboxylase, partial [Chloroflexota bacterium]|nr:cis-3-alkyl-4-acyloxetan-2-one decarboxylase [Chloroflexota bacterium]
LDRDGLRYHYLDEGEGEPVVMVHGNPTWSFYYRGLVEGLRSSYRTIVPDHIGCGLSDKPGDARYDYTLESRVADLEALVDHLGLDGGLTLVVHDWGGAIGLAYATRHPEQIARLVILNTAAFHLPASKSFPWPLWACRNTPLSAWLVRGLNAFCRGTARIGCTKKPLTGDVRDAYCAPYDSWQDRIAVHRFVQDIPLRPGDRSYDLITRTQDSLARLAGVPTWIGWGMKDFVFDHHFLAEWVRRFPGAEVHRFDRAGHYVLEDEGEQIVPLVRAFLAAHPALREVG